MDQVEDGVGKQPEGVRPASVSPWLCLWYTEADLSREKERSMVKAVAPLPRDPGLCSGDT